MGGLNAFVCVCVFKKVKDFERGEFELSPKKHVSFSLLPFFHPFSFFASFLNPKYFYFFFGGGGDEKTPLWTLYITPIDDSL